MREAQVLVVGGEAVSIQGVLRQAAFIRVPSNAVFEGQFCGATIIDPFFWIVTDAHCLVGLSPTDLKVAVSTTRLNGASAQQLPEVAQIILHPDYARGTNIINGIAPLRLACPIDCPNGHGAPIAIAPPSGESAGLPGPGVMGFVPGWGNTQRNGFIYPDSLHAAPVQIISNGMANRHGPMQA